ncbi:MAG: DUF502 domain-containing protein [candidate division Zixibacteria bacterium]
MSFKEDFRKTVKNRFLAGILVIVPLFTAAAILKFAVETIDNLIGPYIIKLIGEDINFPLIGLVVTLMAIMLAGIFTSNLIGRKIYGRWEMILLRIPLFSTLYSAAKQFIEGVVIPDNKTFEKVVMVEYPRKGIFVLGFLANRITIHNAAGDQEFWSVFLPSSPTPFTGITILLPAGVPPILDMTVEEGIKFFVSGSVSAPKNIKIVENVKTTALQP